MSVAGSVSSFGRPSDGEEVVRIALCGGGLSVCILNHGARVQDLRLDGVAHPLVIGSDTLAPYLGDMAYYGAIVGRFANRIAGGAFTLDGQLYTTDRNEDGRQTLHGGAEGASAQIWQVESVSEDSAVLTLHMPDRHMGFPGRLQIRACYTLPGDGTLALDIEARTNRATPCSLAHHGYFALDEGGSVAEQTLWIDADRYLPVDERMIPTPGGPADVTGTRFDFRAARQIGTAGVDHNFCLNGKRKGGSNSGGLRRMARLDAGSLALEVQTDQPGLQVYDGARQPEMTGLGRRRHGAFAGIALETQAWPDAVNRPDFPGAVLRPGEVYRHAVRYVFARKSTV